MLVMAACSSSKDTGTTATTQKAPAYAATLEPIIDQVMKDNVIPGAVVLIESPGQGDWTATFGTGVIGEVKPLIVGDHFRIGSNTKTMTSTVILQLVQEGKLSLEDPVSKYVPGVPNGDQITIAQLSEMRSGLYAYSADPEENATLDREPGKAWAPDEVLKIAFSHLVDFAPGARPTNPSKPGVGYALGIVGFPGGLMGHDGQIPGFMSFMGYNPTTDLTMIILTNLATVPTGEGSALTIFKAILPVLLGGQPVAGAEPAAKLGHEHEQNNPAPTS